MFVANNEALEDLSLDQIQERLRHVDNNRVALQKALKQRRQKTRKLVAQEVKELITAKGHDVSDILSLVTNKKRTNKPARSYTHYVDPENSDNEYVRGVVPNWMREQMKKQGFDPKNKDHRKIFKEQKLQKQTETK